MKKYSDPFWISARFESKCSNCGVSIKKNDRITVDRYRGMVYCTLCGEDVMKGLAREKSMDEFGTDIY